MRATRTVICVGIAVWMPQLMAQPPVTGDYRLHAGDTIDVAVWNEPELKRSLIILPDGKVSVPLAGEIVGAGRTIAEVRGDIETRLRKFVSEPVVTVTVTEVGGNRVYVVGQVNKPGAYVMNPQLNVLQALSIAGGATAFANVNDIVVIRSGATGQQMLRFNFGQVSSGRELEQNISLESGDVLLVP